MTQFGLLGLPEELQSLLITDWLDLKGVIRLDSSICNKISRENWLEILKCRCIFRSVSVAYYSLSPSNYPNSLRWYMPRQARTLEFCYGEDDLPVSDLEEISHWLQKSVNCLTTLKIVNDPPFYPVIRAFPKLRVLNVRHCELGDSFWDLLRSNPPLEELHIQDRNPEDWKHIPTNLSLPNLTKLRVLSNSLRQAGVQTFLSQHPSLLSLQLGRSDFADIYLTLHSACPKLVQLDLRYIFHRQEHNDVFYSLMKSLKHGLRCLVLPITVHFTKREIQSIADYHSHSLRCLSIPEMPHANPEREVVVSIGKLINNLPHLHTLSLLYRNLTLLRYEVTNPAITYLLLELGGRSLSSLKYLRNQCPSVTKISLLDFDNINLVRDLTHFLQTRPLIQTIYIEYEEVMLELKNVLPHISFLKYEGIDIFKNMY